MSQTDFPVWISATHFLNLLFLVLLARSGIQILASFPRLFLDDGCTPGREVLKFTRKPVPAGRLYQSLDEEADVPSWLALPGGKGATGGLGVGRHWHLFVAIAWLATGCVYVLLLLLTGEWRRIVPTSWSVFPDAVAAANTYLHFHLAEPPAGQPYNPLQQLAYFGVVFLLAPLQIATGAAMSPAVAGRFPWYTRLFGTRQAARTIHFVCLLLFGAFVVVHTAMVVAHGLPKELAAIALANPAASPAAALTAGAVGIAFVLVVNVVVTLVGRRNPRQTQTALGRIVDPIQRVLSRGLDSRQDYSPADVTRYFWVNGYPPPDAEYRRLAERNFSGWTLKIRGEIAGDLELSLDDLRRMPSATQVTRHNCIQGWSGIAQWRGVPLSTLMERCRILPSARYIVFYAFDDKSKTQGEDGYYYETLDVDLALRPQTILAYEFNGAPLPVEHGAPLRLRVESQLGFKMVKWIREIAFVRNYRRIGLGYGGWREDHAYYSRVVGI
ncbi:MAG TPA: molybdopterin-dependent oxidoreductase [Candidatus Dormibacteraeota bacterium]|nr:molybdopterin-dependent oxidoreductase [Candidatus Dormibacteraeota bacterium]